MNEHHPSYQEIPSQKMGGDRPGYIAAASSLHHHQCERERKALNERFESLQGGFNRFKDEHKKTASRAQVERDTVQQLQATVVDLRNKLEKVEVEVQDRDRKIDAFTESVRDLSNQIERCLGAQKRSSSQHADDVRALQERANAHDRSVQQKNDLIETKLRELQISISRKALAAELEPIQFEIEGLKTWKAGKIEQEKNQAADKQSNGMAIHFVHSSNRPRESRAAASRVTDSMVTETTARSGWQVPLQQEEPSIQQLSPTPIPPARHPPIMHANHQIRSDRDLSAARGGSVTHFTTSAPRTPDDIDLDVNVGRGSNTASMAPPQGASSVGLARDKTGDSERGGQGQADRSQPPAQPPSNARTDSKSFIQNWFDAKGWTLESAQALISQQAASSSAVEPRQKDNSRGKTSSACNQYTSSRVGYSFIPADFRGNLEPEPSPRIHPTNTFPSQPRVQDIYQRPHPTSAQADNPRHAFMTPEVGRDMPGTTDYANGDPNSVPSWFRVRDSKGRFLKQPRQKSKRRMRKSAPAHSATNGTAVTQAITPLSTISARGPVHVTHQSFTNGRSTESFPNTPTHVPLDRPSAIISAGNDNVGNEDDYDHATTIEVQSGHERRSVPASEPRPLSTRPVHLLPDQPKDKTTTDSLDRHSASQHDVAATGHSSARERPVPRLILRYQPPLQFQSELHPQPRPPPSRSQSRPRPDVSQGPDPALEPNDPNEPDVSQPPLPSQSTHKRAVGSWFDNPQGHALPKRKRPKYNHYGPLPPPPEIPMIPTSSDDGDRGGDRGGDRDGDRGGDRDGHGDGQDYDIPYDGANTC